MAKSIQFRLNGRPTTLSTDGGRTLLWVLRTDLALTGAKYGCGAGFCGACTVAVDGKAVRSCITPLAAVDGKDVVTIEGLAEGETLHPLQQAFLDHGGYQCGYCTPGMIMHAYAFLRGEPHPTRRGDRGGDGGQPLPLRRAQADRRRHRGRGPRPGRPGGR